VHTVGALVLANYGRQPQLVLAGHAVGERLAAQQATAECKEPEKGSIIIVVATDAPLDARQLRRLALRAGAGLARTGSVFGHGSGDIVLAFSTAYTVPDRVDRPMPPSRCCTTACSTASSRPRPTAPSRPFFMRSGAPRP
jgi:D-aminopeptidase